MARLIGMWLLVWTVLGLQTVWATEVGLVTAVTGSVALREEKALSDLKPFVKLREGDRLSLKSGSRVQVVYFEGGRQETWQGAGMLEIGKAAGRASQGGLRPEVKTLPPILVKQLIKTPSPDGSVKAGMVRMRAIGAGASLDSVEKTYAELRKQATPSDRNPELYLLASYLELKEYDRLETLLRQLAEKSPGDPELAVLTSLYRRAINNAKMAAK